MLNLHRHFAAISLMLWAATPAPVSASFMTGNDLLASCKASKAMCAQYTIGSMDAQMILQWVKDPTDAAAKKRYICVPDGVDSNQATDVVVKYLEDKPEERHWPAAASVRNAILAAFPCP